MPRTLIISNRLPVKIKKEKDQLLFSLSEGGLATGLGSIYKEKDNLWIGWPGIADLSQEQEKDVAKKLRKDHLLPVFLTSTEVEEYYEGFSNETLWPNFHYFNQHIIYDEGFWNAYKEVNNKFALEVIKHAQPEDTIWIHDYQLLLLPELIRNEFPEIGIGFFLHIPFPSYESFRLLPWRKELLFGILGADFIGFHTYDDMRHFLSSVNRLAGIGNEHGRIHYNNRIIMADALPMGIDYDKYARSASSPETLSKEARYRASLKDTKLILSIDRLDYSKGIPQRLKAFNEFLSRYPEYICKVSLFILLVPSRDTVEKYRLIREEIELLVGRINGEYGRIDWTPVHYFYRSFPLESLSALYKMASVALVTPMRDGMNLVCKEFIASKLDQKGVLILSEMAGASKELSDAILVNPNDLEQMVSAIRQALEMPEEQQKAHLSTMQKTLKQYNIHNWVKLFMDRLSLIKKEQKSLETKLLDSHTLEIIKKDYNQSKQRLILMDYDGTLVGFHNKPESSIPDPKLKELLTVLTSEQNNHCVVISGRERKPLFDWLGEFDLSLVAEHGAYIKYKGNNNNWELTSELTNDWKAEVKMVMEEYVNRTPGSFIEEKDYSLVWHYRKVETGLGEVRTRELTSHLNFVTANKNLHVMDGKMVVEVKHYLVNKGIAVEKMINVLKPDFILCLGDDWTDEDMFKVLDSEAYTVKVGNSQSSAKFYVENPEKVRKLLNNIVKKN